MNMIAMMILHGEALSSPRDKLLARAIELRERLEHVRRDLKRERDPLPRDSEDAAIAVENDEVLQALEQSAASELERIERALERLQQGTYNRCGKCGVEIDAARLLAVPCTTLCHTCAAAA